VSRTSASQGARMPPSTVHGGGDDEPGECERGHEIVPNFSFATAPAPKIIVIPRPRMSRVKRRSSGFAQRRQSTDVTMSVCTGAFVLAKTGLLSGKPATTITTRTRIWRCSFRISRSNVERAS